MLLSNVKSKLLQLYPNFTTTSSSIFINAHACTNKNPIIRKITTTSCFANQNFGSVFAARNGMFARTFTTVKSTTLTESWGPIIRKITTKSSFVNHAFSTSSIFARNRLFASTFTTVKSITLADSWGPRKMALQLKGIMTKYRKTSYVTLAMCLLFLRVERVPFSGRRHLVIRSPKHFSLFRTRMVTDSILEGLTLENAKVLPSTHEKTLRVASIARKLGQGMHDVLELKKDFKVVAYETGLDSESNPGFTVGRQTSSYNNTPKRWSSKGFIRGYSTRNLEGRDWKVSVIDSPEINAYSVFGHIVIWTGLLDKASDDEAAYVIGHEMGHVIGEHVMENIMWYLPQQIIITPAIIISAFFNQQDMPNNTYNNPKNNYYQRNDKIRAFVRNGRRRRRELEADYIGMMLMASAGYNPQAALMSISKYFSSHDSPSHRGTHPNGCDRITYLKSPERMNKAMHLYKEVTSMTNNEDKEC